MDSRPARKGKKLGVGRKLTIEQETAIFNLICSKRPWQVGFTLPYHGAKLSLWTRDLVMQLIVREYEIKLSDGGLVNHLKRWGFPLTSHGKRTYDRCTVNIRDWLDEHYADIQERAQAEDAEIYWLSKTALLNSEAGITPASNKGRQQLSAINNQGKIHWLIIKGQFTPERQIMLLKSLAGQSRKKVFLIRDDLSYYAKRDVVDWMRENAERVELFPPLEWKPEENRKVATRGQ